jgi:Alr-MurF fusion protein
MIHFSQLEKITNGKILSLHQDVALVHLLLDSRKTIVLPGAVFFAVGGTRNDGHAFLETLYQQGIRNFIVERETRFMHKDVNVLRVSSSIQALQALTAFHRQLFQLPVIGITGSNGKTIVKEWLHQVLASHFSIVKNPGSYNSQIGVPLSVWNIQAYHTLGIFEAGISTVGEMEKLERVIRPTIGVFTNIGTAHNEGFDNMGQKIEEKLKLFAHTSLLIYCSDHAEVREKISQTKTPSVSWGFHAKADIKIKKEGSVYAVQYKNLLMAITLPFTDAASVENCFHCVAVMLHFHFSEKEIQEKIQLLRSVPMRLELKEGINQCQVIDDSYNNDLAGLQISLDFLNNQKQKQKKSLILSDVLQSGVASAVWSQQVAQLVEGASVDKFIGVGEELVTHQHLFDGNSSFYTTTDAFLKTLQEEDFSNEMILVKGARAFAFERIVQRLQRKVHGTIMEIDLGAMVHNLNYFRASLKPTTKIMAMVKAFAYGSGSTEVANLLQYHRVDYLGVAYADEGVALRKNNIRLPIMVMNPSPETFDTLLAHSLEPEIYSFGILHHLIRYLAGKPCVIHIKFDTGMHRLGFNAGDLPELKKVLREHRTLKVASIFSHLAGADDAQHDAYSHEQAGTFLTLANSLCESLGYKPLYHLLNSPGILRLPQYQFDMVRLGIGLYGIDPTAEKNLHLKPVASLKTIVSQLHTLKPGETVGYGRHGKTTDEKTIATITIGYADGYNRAFSKGIGEVLIKGQRANVIGNVCMDMTMVDVTGIDVKEGDEVIVFGDQLPIEEVAAKINTIPYEILTSTSERVKRVFVAEGI